MVGDASALIELLIGADEYDEIEDVVHDADVELHAPYLCDVEVASSLRRAIAHGQIDASRASIALLDYAELMISRHEHLALLPRVMEIRNNFTAYDATYVALAESLEARLMTVDARLARATRAHTTVEVLP